MSERLRTTVLTVAVQYGALALGCLPVLAWYRPLVIPWFPGADLVGWLLRPETLGVTAALNLLVETIRRSVSSRLQRRDLAIAWLCLCLLIDVGWLMAGGISLEFKDSDRFVIHILLLLPFLLAIGPLVRSRAWSGLTGAVLFHVAALWIVLGNGFFWRSGIGFFHRWVS